jgi:hypothetical protein
MKKLGYKKMVDPTTGEIQTFILIGHEFEDADFVKIPFISLQFLMQDKDIAKSAMRVLAYIIRHKISFDNYSFVLSYEYDIKGNIDITERQFHRAMQVLVKKDLVIKLGRTRYMLNPRYFRYGKVEQLKKFEEQYDKFAQQKQGGENNAD